MTEACLRSSISITSTAKIIALLANAPPTAPRTAAYLNFFLTLIDKTHYNNERKKDEKIGNRPDTHEKTKDDTSSTISRKCSKKRLRRRYVGM